MSIFPTMILQFRGGSSLLDTSASSSDSKRSDATVPRKSRISFEADACFLMMKEFGKDDEFEADACLLIGDEDEENIPAYERVLP